MEQVYPLTEETIAPLRGQVVCAITKDGKRHIGVLHSCSRGRLVLNGPEKEELGDEVLPSEGGLPRSGRHRKSRSRLKKHAKVKVRTKTLGGPPVGGAYGYSPYGYARRFGPPIGLDLALIAFLFLLI